MLFRANYELLQSRYGCWLVQFTNDSILPIKKKKYLHKNITQYTNISEKKTVTALKHAKEKITKMKNNWKGFFGVLLKKNIWTYSRGNDEKKKKKWKKVSEIRRRRKILLWKTTMEYTKISNLFPWLLLLFHKFSHGHFQRNEFLWEQRTSWRGKIYKNLNSRKEKRREIWRQGKQSKVCPVSVYSF